MAEPLTRCGFKPKVYEQSNEIKEIGAGIQVTPNSAKVLRALGLEGELKSWAFEPQTMVTRDSITGREVSRIQAMGANGLRADYPLARHLAAAKIAAYTDGSIEMMNERIGAGLAKSFT